MKQAYAAVLGADIWLVKIRKEKAEMPFIKHKGETAKIIFLSYISTCIFFSPADFDRKHVTVI